MKSALEIIVIAFGLAFAVEAHASSKVDVRDFNCVRNGTEATCEIHLKGIISESDFLYISQIADADKTYFNDIEIGSTGFFFGRPFYALFFPRIYSLERVAGVIDPTITVRAFGILVERSIGVSRDETEIRVVSKNEAGWIVLSVVFLKGFWLLLIGALGLYSVGVYSEKVVDGWSWNEINLRLLPPAAMLFNLSMTKLPRILIPSLLSAQTYFQLHALAEFCSLWCCCGLLATVSFEGGTSLRSVSLKPIRQRWLRYLPNLSLAFGLGLMSIASIIGSKPALSRGVLMFAVTFVAIAWVRVRGLKVRDIALYSSKGSQALVVALLVCAIVLVRDALVYFWFHGTGTQYYIQYFVGIVALASGYRCWEYRRLKLLSSDFANRCRDIVSQSPAPRYRGRSLCEFIQQQGEFARVSLVGIKDGQAVLLASEGSESLIVDDSTREPGPLLRIAMERRELVYSADGEGVSSVLNSSTSARACLLIPVMQDGRVVAAIAVMGKNGEIISPRKKTIFSLSAFALNLEVISLIDNALALQVVEQLKAIANCTSGIVFENTDNWGRLRHISSISRRVIVSADCLRSTRVSELASSSEFVWNRMIEFKRELYATWFALQERFEFVSKDVRGDDFWALSPLKFSSEVLRDMGHESAAILLASLIEKHARLISQKPEFRSLGLVGAHVGVGVGKIRVLTLGIPTRQCVDVDSPYMARLHRVRSEAYPGTVLIDASDHQMSNVLATSGMFEMTAFRSSKDRLNDLIDLPDIRVLVALHASREVDELEHNALQVAAAAIDRQIKDAA